MTAFEGPILTSKMQFELIDDLKDIIPVISAARLNGLHDDEIAEMLEGDKINQGAIKSTLYGLEEKL
jgi:hypothetical protein